MVRRLKNVRWRRSLEDRFKDKKRRLYYFAWSLPIVLGLMVTTSHIMPSTYGYFQSKKESKEVLIKAASIDQYLDILPGKAKAKKANGETNQQPVATFSENNQMRLDFGELVHGSGANFEEVLTLLPLQDDQIHIYWKVVGDIAPLVDQSKTEISKNRLLNVKFDLDKDIKPQTYTGYIEIGVNGEFLSVSLPTSVTVREKAEELLYRVILDGKQIMALSQEEKAKDVVRKAIESGEAQSGKVQRNTDNEYIFEFPLKDGLKEQTTDDFIEEIVVAPELEPEEENVHEPFNDLEAEAEPFDSKSVEKTEDLLEEIGSEQTNSDSEGVLDDDMEEVDPKDTTLALPVENTVENQEELISTTSL